MFFTYPDLILLYPKTLFSSPLRSIIKKKKKKESLQAGIAAPITLTSFSSQVFPGGHFFFHSVASEICNPSLATTPIIEPLTLCRPGNQFFRCRAVEAAHYGGVIKRVSTVEQKPTESECHRANYIHKRSPSS